MATQTTHWHTTDWVNGISRVHENERELALYLRGTGVDEMRIRECDNPECSFETTDEYDY